MIPCNTIAIWLFIVQLNVSYSWNLVVRIERASQIRQQNVSNFSRDQGTEYTRRQVNHFPNKKRSNARQYICKRLYRKSHESGQTYFEIIVINILPLDAVIYVAYILSAGTHFIQLLRSTIFNSGHIPFFNDSECLFLFVICFVCLLLDVCICLSF